MSFFAELKRRNVFRAGIAYGLIAWVILQAVDFLVQLIAAPNWVLQVFFIAAAIGFLVVVIFSWLYEMTPEGLKKEAEVDRSQSITPVTGRKLDRIIIVFLAVAVAFLLGQRYWSPTTADSAPGVTESAPVTDTAGVAAGSRANKSVAVLPFVALSSGPDDEYFADGLTEEILNSLAQLPELLVTARTSSFAFKGEDQPIQDIAKALGVQHVVEGSVRRAGDRLRVTAQLIRAGDGFHLWSENYDSTSQDTIEVQEDIATQIAEALDVVMDDERREAMREAGLRDPAAFIAFQRGITASRIAHGSKEQIPDLLAANEHFEKVLARVPDYPPALLEHADAYVHIIVDQSTDEPTLRDVPADIIDRAYDIAVSDLSLARDHALNLDQRNMIEFDLAVISGDFYRIRQRIESYLDSDDCNHPSWVDPMATVFGYAERFLARMEIIVGCDPMGPVKLFSRARAANWTGNPAAALALVEAARERVSHPWLDVAETHALLALGQFETVSSKLQRSENDPFMQFVSGFKLAAAQGNEAAAEQQYRKVKAAYDIDNIGNFFDLEFHASLGHREEANRIARAVDEKAFGPLPLILTTLWCACGAPFDLEATPNFAAKLQQGNLPWPPPTVINFPLKDW